MAFHADGTNLKITNIWDSAAHTVSLRFKTVHVWLQIGSGDT